MSDYISELRRDLVEAAERQARAAAPAGRRAHCIRAHGRRRRWPARRRSPRRSSPWSLTLTTLAPPPKPSDAKIVATVQLGGQPRDAVLAGGSLWIADYEGRVVQFDPATRRVRARTAVGGTPVSVAATAARSGDEHRRRLGGARACTSSTPAAGSVLDRVAVRGLRDGDLAPAQVGSGSSRTSARGDLERIDLDSHRRTALIPDLVTMDLAVNGQSVWTRERRPWVRDRRHERPRRQPRARDLVRSTPRRARARCSPTATASGRWTTRAACSSAWRAAAWFGGSRWA